MDIQRSLIGAGLAAALLFLPRVASASDRPVVRLDFELGAVDLLDEGSLNHELERKGFAALHGLDTRVGGRLGFEAGRVYFGTGFYSLQGSSGTTGLSSTEVLVELGYRIVGKAPGASLTPVAGVGVGITQLALGSQGDGGTSFSQALGGRGLVDLNAVGMLVQTGLRADFLRLSNVENHFGLAFSLFGGLEALPVSSGWHLSDASGQAGSGQALKEGPRVPGTGPALDVGVVFTF